MRVLKAYFSAIDWVPTLFLVSTPILALTGLLWFFAFHDFFSWHVVLFCVFYLLSALSITGGYHRLFAHKAYETSRLVRWFFLIMGAGAFQNSALKWAADHRIHHKHVDEDLDPYSMSRGFWYAHIGWMLVKDQHPTDIAKVAPDLLKDKWIVLQHKYYIWVAIFSGLFLPGLVGFLLGSFWQGVLFGGLLRFVVLHHFTFFINSACHYWGKQNYTDRNSARDSWLLAIFTCGEGYHNFHHYFQADYRNGIRWFHWDPTKWMIQSLALIGVARRLKRVNDGEILKARLEMDRKKLLTSQPSEAVAGLLHQVELMRERVEQAHKKWEQLSVEYRQFKQRAHEKACVKAEQFRLMQIRAESHLAKVEFKLVYSQWRYLVSTMSY